MTEFASAADHTQTREKWLEMGIPIRKHTGKSATEISQPPESVFEDYLDNTDPATLSRRQASPQQRGRSPEPEVPRQRWKYTAPHIGGIPPGEFQKWLDTTITPGKKAAWKEYLRRHVLRQRLLEASRQARSEGRVLTAADIPKLREKLNPTDQEVEQEQKKLRDYHVMDNLTSDLSQLLTDFLDLPVLPTSTDNVPARNSRFGDFAKSILAGDKAPPTTHPSAGLSHLRTNAIMDNHPLYGPQKARAPVEARVIHARTQSIDQNVAILGVGGFVARDSYSSTHGSNSGTDPAKDLDPDLIGGNKVWVHPDHATIDHRGRVNLTTARAGEEPIAVKTGNSETLRAIFEKKNSGLLGGGYVSPRPTAAKSRVEAFDLGGGKGSQEDIMKMFGREGRVD